MPWMVSEQPGRQLRPMQMSCVRILPCPEATAVAAAATAATAAIASTDAATDSSSSAITAIAAAAGSLVYQHDCE